MTETEQQCCTPGCDTMVSSKRAALFPSGKAPCLDCGESAARKEKANKARSVVTLHKSVSVYVGTGDAGRQYAKDAAQMRRGTHG